MAFGLVAHPLPIPPYVLGQSGRPWPHHPFFGCTWEYRRAAGELRWNLNQRLIDEYRDRVEVTRMGLRSETLSLQRD